MVLAIPTRGERKLRSTSAARAFRGEMYSTRQRCAAVGGGVDMMRSMDHRKAARVFPLPVGATTRAWSPFAAASHAPCCAAVGRSKASENQVRVGAVKRESSDSAPVAFSPARFTAPLCWVAPTSAANG